MPRLKKKTIIKAITAFIIVILLAGAGYWYCTPYDRMIGTYRHDVYGEVVITKGGQISVISQSGFGFGASNLVYWSGQLNTNLLHTEYTGEFEMDKNYKDKLDVFKDGTMKFSKEGDKLTVTDSKGTKLKYKKVDKVMVVERGKRIYIVKDKRARKRGQDYDRRATSLNA